jgi:hypothetical protein
MKTLLLLAFAPLFMFGFTSETKTNSTMYPDSLSVDTSYKIYELVDEMTDKVYYTANRKLILANDEKTKGFSLRLDIEKNKDGKLEGTGILASLVGLGSCCEKVELIVMFEDQTKFSLLSWNKFNCKGDAWFFIKETHIKQLSEKKLLRIRIRNGFTGDMFTQDVESNSKNYFMNFFRLISLNKSEKFD